MRQRLVVLMAALIVLTVPIAKPETLATSPSAPGDDLAAYAKLYGITSKEAERQLKLEEGAPQIEAKLEGVLGEDFAGFWLDHRPSFSVHVAAVGDHKTAVEAIVTGTRTKGSPPLSLQR